MRKKLGDFEFITANRVDPCISQVLHVDCTQKPDNPVGKSREIEPKLQRQIFLASDSNTGFSSNL